MSKIVETALSGLREFGLKRLAELDSLCDSHHAWLVAAIGDVKREIAETGQAAKKRRVGADSVEHIVEDNNKAGGATERRARRNRGGPKFLETVAEENGHDEEEQKEEEEPIIAVAPEPTHAPVVEEPKPAAKVTRARRGKKANTEPEKPTDEPVAAPEEPAQDEPSIRKAVAAAGAVEDKPARAARATRRTKATKANAVDDVPSAPIAEPEAALAEEHPVAEAPLPKKRGRGAKKAVAVVENPSPVVALAPEPEVEIVIAEEPVEEAAPVAAPKRGGRKPAAKSKAPAKKAASKAKAPARQQPARRAKTPATVEEPENIVAAAPVVQQEPEGEKPVSEQPDESFEVDLSMPATQETQQKSITQMVIENPASIKKQQVIEEEEEIEALEVEMLPVTQPSPLAVALKEPSPAPEAIVEKEEEAVAVAAPDAATAVPQPSPFAAVPSPAPVSNETATPASILNASDAQINEACEVEQPVLEATQLVEEEEALPAVEPMVEEEDEDEDEMVDAVSMPDPEEEDQQDPQSPSEPLADEIDDVVMEEEPVQPSYPVATAAAEEDEEEEELAAEEELEEEHDDGVEIIDEEYEQNDQLEACAPVADAEVPEQQGIAANLVSTIRSFLPASKPASPAHAAKPKKHPKVKALEAAEAARRKEEEKAAERLRQKHEAERLRQERIKTKAAAEAEAARTREEARLRREEEAAQRRKEREEVEKREREEKARRLELLKQKRKEEAAAAAAAAAAARAGAESRPAVASTSAANSLAEAKERLAKIQQQTALLAQQATKPSASVNATLQPTRLPEPSAAPKVVPSAPAGAPAVPSSSQRMDSSENAAGPQTYEISPYKSDFESDDDEPKKPVPEWARGKALVTQLVAQTYIDPDEVFQHHIKTCTLDEVFAQRNEAKGGRQDFNRRSSSGNWFEDRVTWKEELAYKKAMGYI